VSCEAQIATDTGCFFEQVMVCPDCHVIAERLSTRCEQTIQMLRALYRISIRQSIINKRLQFQARHLEEAPEVDFLGELMKMVQEVRMQEAQEAQCQSSTSAPSTETTRPSVSVAVGPPSSDSPSGSTTK
jgi:hypothetical protein